MTNTVTASFTDNVSVVAAAVLARGSTARGTLDLRSKYGAYLFVKIGRGGTTGLTNGVDVRINRVLNNDTATPGGVHPGGIPLLSSIAAAASTTIGNADANSGQAVVTVASTTSFAAGDLICIQDADAGVTRLEFQRVSKVAGGANGTLTLDRNLQYTHTSLVADTVRNKADVFAPIWLAGGSLWEVIFDYGDDAAGDSVTVQAKAQTYDSDSIA
jgi:hypothetical protein